MSMTPTAGCSRSAHTESRISPRIASWSSRQRRRRAARAFRRLRELDLPLTKGVATDLFRALGVSHRSQNEISNADAKNAEVVGLHRPQRLTLKSAHRGLQAATTRTRLGVLHTGHRPGGG